MVPVVVRLDKAGVCGCGAVVAAGDRAGSTRHPGRIVCLTCLAAFSAGPEGESQSETPEDEPVNQAPDDVSPQELRTPAAVLIPANWAPSDPITLPGWQRSAGVAVALPAEAPPTARPAAAGAPAAVAEATTPHTVDAAARATPEALEGPPLVAATVEAVAMTVPSHRRRTLLPAGLLALRSSRGRQPGSTGSSDSTVRALLDSAADAGVLALHDRRMPGRRGRLAHLALGPGGVYVIDVVRAKHASVVVRVDDELDPDTPELVVGGRPMTQAVSAARGRVAIVRGVLDEVELTTVPATGVLCFVDAAVPSDTEIEVAGVRVVGRTGLSALVASEGALDRDHLDTLVEYLTEQLPA